MDEPKREPAWNTPDIRGVQPATETVPEEPFACPACGQMLAPTCRVCVACREPVDWGKVQRAERPPAITTFQPPVPQQRAPLARVQFSWSIFLVSVAAYFALVSVADRLHLISHIKPFWVGLVADCALSTLGAFWLYREGRGGRVERPLLWALGFLFISAPCYLIISYGAEALLRSSRLKPLEAGLLIDSAVRVSCALWIFYDARVRGVPRRLRWSLGSFLIWIIVFPWYLSRRRTPKVHCLIMEAQGRKFVWTVAWLILLYAVLGMILGRLGALPH